MVKRLLGVEMGVDELRWALIVGDSIEQKGSTETPRAGLLHAIDAVARTTRGHRPDRLGVAVPGDLNRTTGAVGEGSMNLVGPWAGYPLRDELAYRVGCPTEILNDARAFGHGELAMGAAKGLENVLFIMLHRGGVGGAYAFEGRILASPDDRLGEFGHLTVEPGGTSCPGCGGRGCLETFASGQAIVRRFRTRSSWSPSGVTAVTDAAEDGDRIAREVLAESGHAVGVILNSLAAAFPAQAAVVGGDIASAVLPWMADEIRAVLAERPSCTFEPDLLPATLGVWGPAVGAALTVPLPVRTEGPPHPPPEQ
ncbi:ROK family protein [Streptomyces spongiae]|uniref:ROK family protein n=1 Tax=Streptomyces spongiae TaxID=565072 RepID=UPI0018833932|nr:ROK family protein [Streptomyces spongiae]